MKKLWVPLAAILIAIGFWYAFKPKIHSQGGDPGITGGGNVSTTPVGSDAVLTGLSAAPAGIVTQPVTMPAVRPDVASNTSATASATTASTLPPLTVLDNARVVMHNYCATFGENPVGDNSEITAALMGKNPKQTKFISDESGLRVNDKGELIDAWGTPFFFHQLSGKVMEIRSAGEDRKMWTFDDQVTR